MLVSELKKDYKRFSLRYLLYEECDSNYSDKFFFSLLIELRRGDISDFIKIQNFTSSRMDAEKMLRRLYAGKVTPVGLPYIIEDYVTSKYLVNT
jgi:hypothetical protein